ncbi:hypothetical protein R54876_GBNLAHCA_00696 [Eupransor demetentiae]|uniref:Uncharacterized protein n=1 Tax=Eupransor demetentiae TaxID=3109584 RepID=A0ABM9N4N2_9LACO|nr:hypothetical protein R54876_GBNLAHCA_00696 [Lactobacillaceae bacterium LMG 33000]
MNKKEKMAHVFMAFDQVVLTQNKIMKLTEKQNEQMLALFVLLQSL